MTPIKFIALVYTAFSLCANPVWGNDALRTQVPETLPHFKIHEQPRAVSDRTFLDEREQPIALEQFIGNTLVVNFWATWCGPCRVEMPGLEALQKNMRGKDFKVITIAAGRNPPDMIDRFFTKNNLLLLTKFRDPKMEFARQLDVTSLPTTVIINREGKEIGRLAGETDWAAEDMLRFLNAAQN